MNILQTKTEAFITPTKPNVLSEDRIYVYVPQATSTNAGIASYDRDDFIVTNGDVSLNREMRDAHTRPEVVLLDSEYFPKETVVGAEGRYYYKYKTSAIHYIEQNLTDEQKQIARENIDAVSNSDLATTLLNYYTKDRVYNKDETYTKTEVNNLVTAIPKFDIKIVQELPVSDISTTTIYLLIKDDTEPDVYDEYIYIDNKWELLGSQTSEVVISAETVSAVIDDTDTIVTMIDGDKLKFSLSNSVNNKLARALVTPRSAPAPNTIELVAIDDGNTQTMIALGDGLVYENGMLRAIVQGGGEGLEATVLDTLTSQSATDALSAKQGNVLYQMAIAAGEKINEVELNSQKHILIGAEGILDENVYNFTVDNPVAYEDYKTHLTKFLMDLNLPIVGDLDTTKEVVITFGDTVYYVHNILKGMEHATIGDLQQIEKYNNIAGYRFIGEMTFFDTGDIVGFAIIPTISVSDVLSLDSDQMDNYMADGGLSQGQLAVCRKVTNNGYIEGALYRFDITYPDTYTWTELSGASSGVIIRRWE